MEGTNHTAPCAPAQVLETRIVNVEKDVADHDKKITAIMNRLPTWATLYIGGLMAACGWLFGQLNK